MEKRDEQIARLHGKVDALRGQVKSLRESLQEVQQSSTWRYTAPLRRLVSGAKRAGGRLQGGGKSG